MGEHGHQELGKFVPAGHDTPDFLPTLRSHTRPRACQVGKLEMHGTGTPLGDPIEAYAALTVYMGAGAGAAARQGFAGVLENACGPQDAYAQSGLPTLCSVNCHLHDALAAPCLHACAGPRASPAPRQRRPAAAAPGPRRWH